MKPSRRSENGGMLLCLEYVLTAIIPKTFNFTTETTGKLDGNSRHNMPDIAQRRILNE